ncbi:MAG: hypothetical protein JXR95_09685 [Deltaproteobacteria bacterium]|nr:hypothetical protein [Deltaproteobacteria bacterium]
MKKYLLIFTVLFALGCGHVNFDPPSEFIEKSKTSERLVLVSSDASRIRLSWRENTKNGTHKFWSNLMKRELTTFKGYKLTNTEEYKSNATIMEFTPPPLYKDYIYTVAVMTNDDDLYILELGCETSAYAEKKKSFLSLLKKVYSKEIN